MPMSTAFVREASSFIKQLPLPSPGIDKYILEEIYNLKLLDVMEIFICKGKKEW
jgi:hypothetical protein